jgi:hypothetical protein
MLAKAEKSRAKIKERENALASRAESGAYNTDSALYAVSETKPRTEAIVKVRKAGRSYLIQLPRLVVLNAGVEAGDSVHISFFKVSKPKEADK